MYKKKIIIIPSNNIDLLLFVHKALYTAVLMRWGHKTSITTSFTQEGVWSQRLQNKKLVERGGHQ